MSDSDNSDKTLAARFFQRFAGLSRGHGEYVLTGATDPRTQKALGNAQTIHEPALIEHWERHLTGTLHLGIVPIRDDATCVFGAIDIDSYDNFDLVGLAKKIGTLGLPLVTCRTKSGGAHLYLFTSEPAPADLVRGKLMEWAISLGHSGVEVYPKQTRLAGLNDYGNWINMPYQDHETTERYALSQHGAELTAEQFLDYAAGMAVSAEELRGIELPGSEEFKDVLLEAPPCLQTLASRGGIDSHRNLALYNFAVYLKKRFGEDMWNDKIDAYNQQFMDPPLGHKEVQQVTRNVGKKSYEYKCSDLPIAPVCNRQICLTRKCGIGTSESDPGVVFGPLIKIETEPPIWIWDVNGARIELDTTELKDQGRFHTKAMEKLNIWPNLVKPREWAILVREKLAKVELVPVPPDAKPEGMMWAYLQDYCLSQAKARSRDELLNHKPWHDSGRVYFSGAHFRKHLEQHHRMKVDQRRLWQWLRERGAEHHAFTIKGRHINVWSIPLGAQQNGSLDVPKLDEIEAM